MSQKKKRPTEIGWDTDDDDSLSKYVLKNKNESEKKSPVTRQKSTGKKIPTLVATSKKVVSSTESALQFSEDACPRKMMSRRRAMVLGNFKILDRDKEEFLEEMPEFLASVKRPEVIRYQTKPRGYLSSHFPKTRYSSLGSNYLGVGDRHHVLWTSEDEEIYMDRLVKLYDVGSIHSYEIDAEEESPKSPWFGLIDPRKMHTSDMKVQFDANMFWTVGLLFKHFGTCGVELWDNELSELATAYHCNKAFVPVANVTNLPDLSQPPAMPCTIPPLAAGDANQDFEVGKRYTGCIVEWRGKYGFLSCTLIPERIFMHLNDVAGGSKLALPLGASINFELKHDGASKGFKAVNAKPFF